MDLGSSLQLDSILSPERGDDCSDGGDTTRLSIIIKNYREYCTHYVVS